MPLTAFDHVNIRTANLAAMTAWYGDVLGLTPGPRPPFRMGGAWLYLAGQPLVHLVEVAAPPAQAEDVGLEHFAFRATGLAAFRQTLDAHGVAHSVDPVPDFPIVQVNFRDPDGNHIHVDFNAAEHIG